MRRRPRSAFSALGVIVAKETSSGATLVGGDGLETPLTDSLRLIVGPSHEPGPPPRCEPSGPN
jgi:hypothetical protein